MKSTSVNSPNFCANLRLRKFSQGRSCHRKLTELAQEVAPTIRMPKGLHFEVFQDRYTAEKPLTKIDTLQLGICNELGEVVGDKCASDFRRIYERRVEGSAPPKENYHHLNIRSGSKRMPTNVLRSALRSTMRDMVRELRNKPVLTRVESLSSKLRVAIKNGNRREKHEAITGLMQLFGYKARKASPKNKKTATRRSTKSNQA